MGCADRVCPEARATVGRARRSNPCRGPEPGVPGGFPRGCERRRLTSRYPPAARCATQERRTAPEPCLSTVPLLDELAVIAAIAVAVTVVLSRLRLPTVAGLLAAGALLGPFGFGLVHSVEGIEVLAEVGVVLLMFTIGLEFSLARLRAVFQRVAVGGLLQVGLTTAAVAAVALGAGLALPQAVTLGFVFALSSTAIVLRALTDRGEIDAPHGRFILGTLVFQDLCVIPMVMVIPLLRVGAAAENVALQIVFAVVKATAVVLATILAARVLVPRALGWVDASRSREVFLLAILALCIGTAWLTASAGLSLALGALLGGMVVADTEYGHRAMGDILPLRDAFVSAFFISLGMLFDVRVVAAAPVEVAALTVGFVAGKGVLATVAALSMRFPARVAWLAGVGLAQFSEFGFVLVRLAEDEGVLDAARTGPLLAAGIVSMFLTPLLVGIAPRITAGERLLAPLERLIGVRGIDEAAEEAADLAGHVVIVGFGLAGRFAARALAAGGVPFLVLELNADNVRRGKADALPVYYGDATSLEALGHARLHRARLLVVLINDPQAAKRVTDTARRVAPHVPVLIRTRYLAEREALLRVGAHDVVAEEVESAVEVIARMLRRLETPRNIINDRLRCVRTETQTSERKLTLPRAALPDVRGLDELKIETAQVQPGSPLDGRSLVEAKLRSATGALVVGIRRGDALLERPDPTLPLQAGDIAYLVGTAAAIHRALHRFDPHGSTPPPPEDLETPLIAVEATPGRDRG